MTPADIRKLADKYDDMSHSPLAATLDVLADLMEWTQKYAGQKNTPVDEWRELIAALARVEALKP